MYFEIIGEIEDIEIIAKGLWVRERARLVEFVKKVTELCKGKAYFTTTMTLGQYLMMDFLRRKTRRLH